MNDTLKQALLEERIPAALQEAGLIHSRPQAVRRYPLHEGGTSAMGIWHELVSCQDRTTSLDVLRRWVFMLLEHERLLDHRTRWAAAWREQSHEVNEAEITHATPRELLLLALTEPSRANHWLAELSRVATRTETEYLGFWEGREELADELGVELAAMDALSPGLETMARDWLAATDELWNTRQ